MKKTALLIATSSLLLGCSSLSYATDLLPSRQPIIAQYFGIWTERNQQWEQKFRQDTPFDKLTRVYIMFAKIVPTKTGHYTPDFDGKVEHVQAIIARVKEMNPNAEIFITLGGSAQMAQAATDPEFADNLKRFMHQYGFTGVDLDWEIMLEKKGLNNLINNLYASLHPAHYKITLDVWPYVHSAYDMSVLKEKLDQINIMSYGTGLNLERIATQYEKAGFPLNKMIGGLETEREYHQFGGVTDSLGATGTIAAKAQYTLLHGLAGMMSWRMDNDYTTTDNPLYPTYKGTIELWTAMQNSLLIA